MSLILMLILEMILLQNLWLINGFNLRKPAIQTEKGYRHGLLIKLIESIFELATKYQLVKLSRKMFVMF